MTNAEVARVFNEIANILEIKGEQAFRVNAYRKAARTIEDLTTDLNELAARGELGSLPGIGAGSVERIVELLSTGQLTMREDLRHDVPDTLLELLRIPSLGPKKAALLWEKCGVASLADLQKAIAEGRLSGIKGLGDKTIEQFRQGIDFLQRSAGRTRLGDAWPLALHLRERLQQTPGVTRCELAGSLRRGCETVGDLDLLCVADDGPRIVSAFTSLPMIEKVLVSGGTKGSVLMPVGGQTIQVDLRVVPAESFGAAWQYFTGSKAHNVRLREMAVKRGWSLNEYALTEGERIIASHGEDDIYKALGLPWLPPELREDRGEFALTEAPSDLLKLEDIRGDLHMHTSASDGASSVEEMAAAAKQRGYEYICITDHSQSSFIANGLKPDRLREHIKHVRDIDRRTKDLHIWVGAEVDILADGRLDYPDDLLAELDFVVASVHQGLGHDSDANTRRMIAAMQSPYVNLLGHPTGRLINRREAMPVNIEAIVQAAIKTGTALELNGNYYRLDLKDQHVRAAVDAGATICIDCDAHATDQLDQMIFGILTARRGWACQPQVLNTRPAQQVRSFVQAKRRQS